MSATTTATGPRALPHPPPPPVVRTWTQVLAFLCALALVVCGEFPRWSSSEARAQSLTGWLCGREADWLPFLPVLLLAPLFWMMRRPLWRRRQGSGVRGQGAAPWLRGALLAASVAASSLVMSAYVGRQFAGHPPAYHDEYSYLFQAKTFGALRLSYPSFAPMPELFDQMHVLNEGRFASRYFPGAGLWIAPWLAAGVPHWGHWAAGALVSLLVFCTGRELAGDGVGWLSGMLTALSPGLVLFSNLLLAHHPTLVGLLLFVWAFFRLLDTGGARAALAAGCGLAFAMLCRPMTAFGIGLPFGLYFAWWLLAGRVDPQQPHLTIPSSSTPSLQYSPPHRLRLGLALAAPLAAGLVGLFFYNRALTGDGWKTPYQLYTEIYTPRHMYGFHNVRRGEQQLGPKVLDHYDRLAEDLTPPLAARNVRRRIESSLLWTLGIVPLVMAAIVLLFSRGARGIEWKLIGWSIVSLHAVHVPYWFEGIMGWHYVLESAPLWLLLFAEATCRLFRTWSSDRRPWMPVWWLSIIGTAVAVNLVTVTPLWPGRLNVGIVEVALPRARYAEFLSRVEAAVNDRRAIVFVEPDPADRHIDYVVNDPWLDGQVLIARYRPGRTDLARARQLFPNREAWLFQAVTGEMRRLPAH